MEDAPLNTDGSEDTASDTERRLRHKIHQLRGRIAELENTVGEYQKLVELLQEDGAAKT